MINDPLVVAVSSMDPLCNRIFHICKISGSISDLLIG